MGQKLSLVRGTTGLFGIVVKNPDGSPFMVIDGQTLVFALKKRPDDEERLIVKKVTNQVEPGVYYLELNVSDTEDLEPGRYFYDVGLQWGATAFFNVVESTEFDIKPNISKLGDGL